MRTSKKIEDDFKKEFQALVNKYKAEVQIKDYFEGYAECGEDIKCLVMIDAVYTLAGDRVSDYCEFDLGTYHHFEKQED